ncbi:MAG: CoA-binding protein [Spirulinaceae cyanobacterium]
MPHRQILLQGISALSQASLAPMQAYGTEVAAVVEVGRGGQSWQGIPVFDLVAQAIAALGKIDTSIVGVAPDQVADAALEAIAAGVRQLVLLPNPVPPLDMLKIIRAAEATGTVILGAGSAGLIVPERFLLGTLTPHFYRPGPVGLIGRTSPQLLEAIATELSQAGMGQSVVVHLGVGNILGSTFADWLPLLAQNEDTSAIVLLEQHLLGNDTAAVQLQTTIQKPVLAYIAGQNLPPLVNPTPAATSDFFQSLYTLPHTCTAAQKLKDYQIAQIPVARSLQHLVQWLQEVLTAPMPSSAALSSSELTRMTRLSNP